jgi:hypothetical protein
MNFGNSNSLTAFEARFEAQKIAFGPVVFQCVRIARKKGLLAALVEGKPIARDTLSERFGLSTYAVDLLMESCLSAGVVSVGEAGYELTKTGYYIVRDRMTQVNFDFVQDVCYSGLGDLEASLDSGEPVGLRHLGDWQTIYHGLSALPEPARTSWFDFDQYYSDGAFPAALPYVFARKPRRIMDIGANTGKWALQCLGHDAEVTMTLLDLPIQLEVAQKNIEAAGHSARASLHPVDLLDQSRRFPGDQDVVWMSQFLSCFSLAQIGGILRRAREALAPGGSVFILDTFWDRQAYEMASYCLINTSPYFTALANGRSKMYRASEYIECATAEGLVLRDTVDGLGLSHSLLRFEAA